MKKGFTLIELIAVIALLGIVITITAINMVEMSKKSNKKLCEEKVTYIESAAMRWGKDNINSLSSICTNVSISSLISSGYLSGDGTDNNSIVVPGTKNPFSGYVCIKYEKVSSTDNYASSYGLDSGYNNYVVSAKYNGVECN